MAAIQLRRARPGPFEGFYVLTTYLLTGEERTTYSQAITPLRPFDPYCPLACGGAWELAARVSRLEVGDAAFLPGPSRLANPDLFSSGATELTLGFNWYLNKLVRAQFNWEHAWFDDPVRLGAGGGFVDGQDALLTRFRVIFQRLRGNIGSPRFYADSCWTKGLARLYSSACWRFLVSERGSPGLRIPKPDPRA